MATPLTLLVELILVHRGPSVSLDEQAVDTLLYEDKLIPDSGAYFRGGVGAMAQYRIYCMDGVGKIDLAEWIEAVDDKDATQKACKAKHNAVICEIWQGVRLVATLDAKDLSS